VNKNITIEDIARLAGVSVGTVSRAINNSGPVSKKTKSKIDKIIKDTNYTPNGLARGLKTRSRTVGLLVPDIRNLYFIDVVLGIEYVLKENGYSSFLCHTDWDSEKEQEYIDLMVGRRVEGLVIMSTFVNESVFDKLSGRDIKIVSIQNGIKGIDSVSSRDEEGAFEATEHLIGLGHRRIAFLGFRNILNSLNRRMRGYCSALDKHGIPRDESLFVYCEPFGDYGYAAATQLFKLDEMPTAILAINDHMIPGIYRALQERGLSVPRDVSVIGFDNTALSEWVSPNLTTVAEPIFEMGKNAAYLLLERIKNGDDSSNREIVLPSRLIVRDSTGRPRTIVDS